MSPARIPTRRTEPTSARTIGVSSSTSLPVSLAGHGASVGIGSDHRGVKNIFEAGQLRHRFLQRRGHDLMGSSLRNRPAVFQNDHPLTQRKDFFPAVSNVNHGNAMLLVPGAQVINDPGLGGRIQCRQRFVEKKDCRIDHQGASQSDPLPFPAGNLSRPARTQVRDPE